MLVHFLHPRAKLTFNLLIYVEEVENILSVKHVHDLKGKHFHNLYCGVYIFCKKQNTMCT